MKLRCAPTAMRASILGADVQSLSPSRRFHRRHQHLRRIYPRPVGAALKPMHTITGDGLHGLATATMLIRTGQFNLVAVEGQARLSNILTKRASALTPRIRCLNRPLRLNTTSSPDWRCSATVREPNQPGAVRRGGGKDRFNALKNPLASFAADLEIGEVLDGPPLAYPLGVHEAAEEVDGAVVMVLASEERGQQPVRQTGVDFGRRLVQRSAALESREWGSLPYIQQAARMAYAQAGIRSPLQAVDFAEVDDTYAYKELQSLEALGVFRRGEAGELTAEGLTYPDGDFR